MRTAAPGGALGRVLGQHAQHIQRGGGGGGQLSGGGLHKGCLQQVQHRGQCGAGGVSILGMGGTGQLSQRNRCDTVRAL